MFYRVPPVAFPIQIVDVLKASARNELRSFEELFASRFGLSQCITLSSGRAALTIALTALKEVNHGRDEVVIPAYTCPTVPLSVARAGLKVKLCDISLETLNIDPDLLGSVINDKTLCVVAVHSFGFPCDMDKLTQLARERDVFLIEDVAQSAGAKWKGKMLGSFGHMSCFSLGRGKSFTTYEGGVLGINGVSQQVRERIRSLYDNLSEQSKLDSLSILFRLTAMAFLQKPRAWWLISRLPLGFENQYHSINFRIEKLSRWQAFLASSVLRKLDYINDIRKRNGEYLIEQLKEIKSINVPKVPNGAEPIYLRLPVVFRDRETREDAYRKLNRAGIGVSRMYINPLHRYDYLADIVPYGSYPIAEYIANRIIALPTHHFLGVRELKAMLNKIKELVNVYESIASRAIGQ